MRGSSEVVASIILVSAVLLAFAHYIIGLGSISREPGIPLSIQGAQMDFGSVSVLRIYVSNHRSSTACVSINSISYGPDPDTLTKANIYSGGQGCLEPGSSVIYVLTDAKYGLIVISYDVQYPDYRYSDTAILIPTGYGGFRVI